MERVGSVLMQFWPEPELACMCGFAIYTVADHSVRPAISTKLLCCLMVCLVKIDLDNVPGL
jgi:hypothetical protein